MIKESVLISILFCAYVQSVIATTAVHILLTGINKTDFTLGTMAYLRPMYEIACQDMNRQFNGSILFTVDFVTESDVNSCLDLSQNIERMISRWYYKNRKTEAVPVLSQGGL